MTAAVLSFAVGTAMIDLTPIPFEQFGLRWRFTDPGHCVLPPVHLSQVQPVDEASATRLLELTRPWLREQPFTRDWFINVESTSIDDCSEEGVRRVRKWLFRQEVPFGRRVFLSWDASDAAVTPWKMLVKYWDDFWYPGLDDLVVFDESLSWALFLWHYGEAFFVSRPCPAGLQSAASPRAKFSPP